MTTITLPRATVEQALEALEAFMQDSPRPYDAMRGQAAMEALRAALAQQAEPVEPYCYVYEYDGVFGLHREFYPLPYNGMKPSRTVPVYTAPPQQPEPAADLFNCPKCGRHDYGMHGACPTCDAQQAEPVPTHRINSWGFCGVCRHDRILGEGCARQECPDSPQQAEPVEPVQHYASIPGTNVRVRLQAEPYAAQSAYWAASNRMSVDPVTGNVSIGAQQAEPVGKPEGEQPAGVVVGFTDEGRAIVDHDGLEEGWVLYTTPPQQAEPVEPVAWVHTDAQNHRVRFLEWTQQAQGYRGEWIKTPLCNCAQPRQTDPQIEDRLARHGIPKP